MDIYSVFDEEFKHYGRVVDGIDCRELLKVMEAIPMPARGVSYEPAIVSLESCAVMTEFRDSLFGGMPTQLGMCWGYNTKLNCLEYHRCSEFNLGTEDFVLLLAKQDELEDRMLDTSAVKAFRVPAGVLAEVYATSLHYAPCHCDRAKGFRVLVALPQGTNTRLPVLKGLTKEEEYMTARNKWLFPHPESDEARGGAKVGLKGENIDIKDSIK